MKKCLACKIVIFLCALASINWLLVAAGGNNIVTLISGGSLLAQKILYILFGFSGVLLAITLLKPCPGCAKAA